MSELNIYHHELRPDEYDEFYLKYEVDKVIAELEKEIDKLQDKVTDLLLRDRNMALNFNSAVDALVHNKYKRCLAMARWCRECSWSKCVEKVDFYYKWYNRWMELADAFKDKEA